MSSMKYHEYCKQRNIPTFPLRIREYIPDEVQYLSNGEVKWKKEPVGDNFDNEKAVRDYYGDELGKYLMEKNGRQNPNGKYHITVKQTDFDMPKPLLRDYIKCRWLHYENGNPKNYTHFAVDTKLIGVVDIDCELPADSPFTALLSKHPFKKSNTKSFGKHILINRDNIPQAATRHPVKLDKRWGVCAGGQPGIEFLNGIWEWAKLNDEIENPDADLTPADWLKQEIIKLISNKHKKRRGNRMMSSRGGGESKTSEPTDMPPAVPVVDAVPPVTDKMLENFNININNYNVESMADPQKCSGVIICCSTCRDERVYDILLNACKRHGANFGTEEWVRERWDTGCPPDTLQDNMFGECGFYTFWAVERKEDFNWTEFMDDDDKCVQERFINNHKHNFIINTDYKKNDDVMVCYYDENDCLWLHDPKVGVAKNIIRRLLMKDEYTYWKTEMEASIEAMDDNEVDDEGQQQPNAFKELAIKFKKKFLRKFHSTGNWLSGTIKNIIQMLHIDLNLRKEVQFNLMENTKHLFQFRNGAYNFKTGEFGKRTRDMYISGDAILKYDFPENADVDEYQPEMTVIDDMLKKILPKDDERKAWCSWKGYCLTGEINGQMFFIYLGASAGNGKSTLMEVFKDAFPCYVKPIGKEAVLDKNKDDKCLSSLANKSFRMIYTEEITQIGLKVKELTQQATPVKPLYMEEILLQIQFKFEGLCNAVPEAKCDEGVLRRARQIECNSSFVDDEEDVDEENHTYLKDPTLGVKFKLNERYKIALFLYFAKYATDYYNRGVNDWKKQFEGMREAFQETNQEDDPLAQFMKYFKREGEEDEHGDFNYHISKAKMLEYLYEHTGDDYVKVRDSGVLEYKSFTKVKREFKKKRFQKYQGSWRKSGSKGFFPNIKYIGGQDDSEEEYGGD